MKIIAFMLLLVCGGVDASDLSDFYNEPDKQKHIQYSSLLTNGMYLCGMTKWQSFTAMMAIGGMKELMDGNTQEEHLRDMLANMIGASTVFATDWVLHLHDDSVTITYRSRF